MNSPIRAVMAAGICVAMMPQVVAAADSMVPSGDVPAGVYKAPSIATSSTTRVTQGASGQDGVRFVAGSWGQITLNEGFQVETPFDNRTGFVAVTGRDCLYVDPGETLVIVSDTYPVNGLGSGTTSANWRDADVYVSPGGSVRFEAPVSSSSRPTIIAAPGAVVVDAYVETRLAGAFSRKSWSLVNY